MYSIIGVLNAVLYGLVGTAIVGMFEIAGRGGKVSDAEPLPQFGFSSAVVLLGVRAI